MGEVVEMTRYKCTIIYNPEPMGIGSVFYVAKDEWSARGSDEKYHEYEVVSDNDKEWICHSPTGQNGTANKRSGRFRSGIDFGRSGKTETIFTPLEKTQKEFAAKYRSEIIDKVRYADPETLIKVARIVGVWNE